MQRPIHIALALSFLAAAGCGATVRQSFTEYALERAAFEMKCPRAVIEIVPLNRGLDDRNEQETQVGVKGCGKQAVYVYMAGAGWIANPGSVCDQKPAPPATPP
jgi:hypothetical protein